jgi:hypothetical protein
VLAVKCWGNERLVGSSGSVRYLAWAKVRARGRGLRGLGWMVGYGELVAVDVGRRRSRESNEGTSFRTSPFCALLAGLARG